MKKTALQGMLPADMRMKRINIWLRQTHVDKLKSVSRQTLVPVARLVRRAVESYLASLEKPKRKKR